MTPRARPDEQDLRDLFEMDQMMKRIKKESAQLRDLCKVKGSFCTDNFACVVTPQERRMIAGLEAVSKVYGLEDLEQHDLIKIHKFLIVHVQPKGWEVVDDEIALDVD